MKRLLIAACLVLAGCTASPDCSSSLLYEEDGWTLASPPGTSSRPTVIFSDPSGQKPDACHYARNQGDEFCTEDGTWVDNNAGEHAGTITVSPLNHACGGFVVGSTYELHYSFDQVPSFLFVEFWSNNQ